MPQHDAVPQKTRAQAPGGSQEDRGLWQSRPLLGPPPIFNNSQLYPLHRPRTGACDDVKERLCIATLSWLTPPSEPRMGVRSRD